MINCICIDDEPLALKQISKYIEKTPFLNLTESFSSAVQALEFLDSHTIDLMFVDINMPDISGMDFVKSLSNPPKLIFTTAYSEYAAEGFQVDAADYLLKPFSYADFLKSTQKVKERYFTKQAEHSEDSIKKDDDFLFIKSEYKIVRIAFNDIIYVESMRDYVRIHLENQKPIMALMGIKKMMEYLPDDRFMRVHRSYIVQLSKVGTIERNRIVFDDNVYIPVSDQYKDVFQKFIDSNFLK